MTNVASYYLLCTVFPVEVRFIVGYLRISLFHLQWDRKENRINFFTLFLGITTVMLSLYYNFHVAFCETDHSQEENREMFFLQMENICLILSTALSCESITFYQLLPPQPPSQKFPSSGDQMVNTA